MGFELVTAAIVALSTVALSTVALSLPSSVTRTINSAHGELMTVGAFAGYRMAKAPSDLAAQAVELVRPYTGG